MQLSSRLQRIADFIPPGDRIIDVGTDHAYIPIDLLLRDPAARAIATDIRPGPLHRARSDAEKYGVSDRLTLLECDGRSLCRPSDCDTVILAGMGGETMIGILSAAPGTKEKNLILQPQTKQDELRAWLAGAGFTIRDAALVHDTGRIYMVWDVERGEMPPWRGVDSALLARRDPLLKPFLEDQIKRCRKRLNGLQKAATQDEAGIAALREQLAALEEIHREVETWQV